MLIRETTMPKMSSNRTSPTQSAAPATGERPSVREVEPQQVQRWLQSGECTLIDVRESDEHARERIPGSQLLPLSQFDPQHAAALARPDQKIVLHCRSGRRSSDACRMFASLADRGATVISMAGGIESWKQQSLPVEVNTMVASISVMRQVQLVIGLCTLVGCALAWFVHPGFVGIPAFFGAGLTFAGATGTCALAAILGNMPWNRTHGGGASCAAGSCV